MNGQVHWEEGLFLQPHHLQLMQRNFLNQLAHERWLAWPYHYGLVASQIAPGDLQAGVLRYSFLEAVLPSGTLLCYPDNAEVPALNISEALKATNEPWIVYLAVPLWSEHKPNVAASGQLEDSLSRPYVKSVMQLWDENKGAVAREDKVDVTIRKINAQLILLRDGDKPPSDMDLLPLLKVELGSADSTMAISIDRHYAPPCLILKGSQELASLVWETANHIEARRKQLIQQLAKGGLQVPLSKVGDLEDAMKVSCLSRASAKLLALAGARNTPPFQLYLELCEILGELSAFKPTADALNCPPYDHNDLYRCFSNIYARIRDLIPPDGPPPYVKVELNYDTQLNAFVARLTAKQVSEPTAYYLAIETNLPPDQLTELVTDPKNLKVTSRQRANTLLRGIAVSALYNRVPYLPANLHYFQILPTDNSKDWAEIKNELILAVVCPKLSPSQSISTINLFMLMPTQTD